MKIMSKRVRRIVHQKLNDLQMYDIERIKKYVDKYDIISFDIFDTLVKRDLPDPTDVFVLMEHELGIEGFAKNRISAEEEARRKTDREEITLSQIYEQIKLPQDIDKIEIEKREMETEIAVTCPNLDTLPIYKYCVEHKKVILTSDMYLDHVTVEKILKKCGIVGYSKLFLSNEVNRTKVSGGLYLYIKGRIGASKILHIGNSFKADYLKAKIYGCDALKIATYKQRTRIAYSDILCDSSQKKRFINAFINNHTPHRYGEKRDYYAFGYEQFGPLLYGFVKWLHDNMVSDSIEQVLFLARDGFIIRKVYHELGYDANIKDYYFEVSRRSLRVPAYNREMSYSQILHELTVPNITSLVQIFDSLGLNAKNYSELIRESGIDLEEYLKRDHLIDNEKFKMLYENIYGDVMDNAEREGVLLEKYLGQFDFSRKTAIVDIGWGGSMQKYLVQTLERLGKENHIYGYYVGLTEKSIENLGQKRLLAKGYVFDRLNGKSKRDMERPFVGLFETLFLELDGSVKRYQEQDGIIKALRYPYEYKGDKRLASEAVSVRAIQKGALKFISDYKNSSLTSFVGYDSATMFSNLYQTGIEPTLSDVEMFGKFRFFNNGSKVYLAKPKPLLFYIIKPKQLIHDLFDSQWKIGFLKGVFKLRLPYLQIFDLLRKASN